MKIFPSTDTIDGSDVHPSSFPPTLRDAFDYCEKLTRGHYENFPVASLFIPKAQRPYVCAVYAFARTADDFADEGSRLPEERLALLSDWQTQLDACVEGRAEHPVFIALAETIRVRNVPKRLFDNLLTAFRMDVTTHRFATFDDLLGYCTHSANPVGRIILHLFDNATPRTLLLSDDICTALQLTNFWQDIHGDWQRGRLYLPLEDCKRFDYHEQRLATGQVDEAFQQLMKFQVDRTRQLFNSGRALCGEVTNALRFELKLVWQGGTTILDKIESSEYDVLSHRPVLSRRDKFLMLTRALVMS